MARRGRFGPACKTGLAIMESVLGAEALAGTTGCGFHGMGIVVSRMGPLVAAIIFAAAPALAAENYQTDIGPARIASMMLSAAIAAGT